MINGEANTEFNAIVYCDMTPYGLGERECQATVIFGPNDDPESIDIFFPLPQENKVNLYSEGALDIDRYFASPDFNGQLSGGNTAFKGRIVWISGMQPLGIFEEIRLSCAIDQFQFLEQSQEFEPSVAVFRLTNVPHQLHGDIGIVRPVSEKPPSPIESDYFLTSEIRTLSEEEKLEKFKPGWVLSASRINFTYGGRNWSLDTTQGNKKFKKSETLRPMVTATLTTEAAPNVRLQELADNICDLLTFAFGKEVRWVSCGMFAPEGLAESSCRRFPLLPYGKGTGAVVDNWEPGNLKLFIEQCESEFNNNPEWWHRSIGLLGYSRATPLLEIRLSTLNTLVDRISKKVIGDQKIAQIDPKLTARIERRWFRWFLHTLLSTLSRNWDQERTERVCDTIKMWNSSPSFPNQVIQACESLGIDAPTRKHLGFRHKLIHVGEFDKKIHKTDQMRKYLQSLEAVVELMMIRLLGFTGYIQIDKHGDHRQKVDEILKPENE